MYCSTQNQCYQIVAMAECSEGFFWQQLWPICEVWRQMAFCGGNNGAKNGGF